MNLLAGAVLAGLVAVGSWWWWRRRQRQGTRIVSLVALLSEPVEFDPLVLAKTAGKLWRADLGDGSTEGDDGVVLCAGPINTIMCRGEVYLINSVPQPYVNNPEAAAESILDLRIRSRFLEHQAWFSCDAVSVDHTTKPAEIAGHYRRLARLFAQFLDERCLLIFVPEVERAYLINDQTDEALQSDEPLRALDESYTLPVVAVEGDDPLLVAAVTKARESWPQFLSAYELGAGDDFSVKAPVTHSGATEFIWLNVTAVEGDRVYGELANDPAGLGPLKFGSKVQVELAELNDWCYIDTKGRPQGGFTVAAVRAASRRQRP